MRVAIVGAGLAGVTCARVLAEHGVGVTCFEKARGPGGRMSRRRIEDGDAELHFDHGAQYFTVRDERFAKAVEGWVHEGVAAGWDARIVAITSDGVSEPQSAGPVRYVGAPGMNEIVKHEAGQLSPGCAIRFGVRVQKVERTGEHWRLSGSEGEALGEYDGVVISAPAPQAAELLGDVPNLRAVAESVQLRPSWTAMVRLSEPVAAGYDAAFVRAGGVLSWVANNASKPGRRAEPCWVAHAEAGWSAEHLERDAGSVAKDLRAALLALPGFEGARVSGVWAHRWRYALVDAPLVDPCLFNEAARIGACGDWCMGHRVEGAYLSGLSVGERLLGTVVSA